LYSKNFCKKFKKKILLAKGGTKFLNQRGGGGGGVAAAVRKLITTGTESACNYIGLFSNNYLTDYMDYVGKVMASNYSTAWTVFVMQLSNHRICDTRFHISHNLTSTIYVNFYILIFTEPCPFLGAFTTL